MQDNVIYYLRLLTRWFKKKEKKYELAKRIRTFYNSKKFLKEALDNDHKLIKLAFSFAERGFDHMEVSIALVPSHVSIFVEHYENLGFMCFKTAIHGEELIIIDWKER